MNKLILIIGSIVTVFSAGLSYYPVFQDFDETDFEIPFPKNNDYPNQRDLIIMNVYSDCNQSDSFFSEFSMNGEKMCDTSKFWINSLLVLIIIGIGIMFVGAALRQPGISKI